MVSPAESVTTHRDMPLPVVRYEWVDELNSFVCIILERRWIEGAEAYLGIICQLEGRRIHVLDQSRADRLEDIQFWAEARMELGGWKEGGTAAHGN